MTMKPKTLTLVLLLSATVVLSACSQQQPSTTVQEGKPLSLVIEDFGPHRIKAGETFNAQPDGASGIWVRVDQRLDGYPAAVWFAGRKLGGTGIDKGTVTGVVPADLINTPGTYEVEIRIGAEGEQGRSNKVQFVVE